MEEQSAKLLKNNYWKYKRLRHIIEVKGHLTKY